MVGSGGFIETAGGQRLNIRHVQPIVAPRPAGRGTDRAPATGARCDWPTSANVRRGPQPAVGRGGDQRRPGPDADRPEVPGANTLDVTRKRRGRHGGAAPGLPGIEIDTTIFRPATFIEQSIDNLTPALLLGVPLVVIIIAGFLFEWRTALISLIAIPLSLIAALLVLDLRGRARST